MFDDSGIIFHSDRKYPKIISSGATYVTTGAWRQLNNNTPSGSFVEVFLKKDNGWTVRGQSGTNKVCINGTNLFIAPEGNGWAYWRVYGD